MDDRHALLPIGRFAELTGLTIRALRHYDRLGLLTPAATDYSSGYRYYAEAQVEEGRRIRFLRGLQIPVQDVQALLHADETRVGRILERHRARLRGEIEMRRRIVRQIPTKEEWMYRQESTIGHEQQNPTCSFCGKRRDEVRRMIAGPNDVIICNECVGLCNKVLADEESKSAAT